MARRTSLVLTLLMLAPTVLALDPLEAQNDAATGGDAPDDAAEAVLVTPGSYEGRLNGGLDTQDWFTVAVSADEVLRLDVRAIHDRVWLRVQDEEGAIVHQNLATGTPIRYVGADGARYRFQLSTDFRASDATAYGFTVSLLKTIPQQDAGSPGDASGIRAQARAVAPGSYEGQLYPPAFDLNDMYRVSKPWGAWINVTFVPEPGKLLTLQLHSATRIDLVYSSDGEPIVVSTGNDVEIIRVRTEEGAPHAAYSFSFDWWVPNLPLEENDAGLGIDAPEGWTDLPLLEEGVHEGRAQFAWGDDIDRFAFHVPAGRYLDVTFTHVEGRALFSIHTPQGQLLQERLLFSPSSWRAKMEAGEYVLSVHRWERDDYYVRPLQAVYRIEAHAAAPPDVAVSDVHVDPPRSIVPMYKIVRATVSNPSALEVTTTVTFYVLDDTGLRSQLSQQVVSIPPGASRQVSSGWSYLASVGEFTVGASASTPFDPNAANDFAEVRASGVVDPGLGVGVGQPVAIIRGGEFGP